MTSEHDRPDAGSSPAANASSRAQSDAWPQWRNAARAKQWSTLPLPELGRLQQAQLVTFLAVPLLPIGLHALSFTAAYFWMRFATTVLRWRLAVPSYQFPVPGVFGAGANWVQSSRSVADGWFQLAHGLDVLVLSVLTFLAAPWFLGLGLKWVDRMQPLSLVRLGQVSPEAQRRVQTDCQQAQQPFPQFGLLPHAAPIAFTYGSGPKTARIVLSQGLLDQLDDAEIAAIVCGELRYIHPLNLGLMTWILALLQVPYLVYRLAAAGADFVTIGGQKSGNRALEILTIGGTYALGLVASIGYIGFTTLRPMGLWFGRQRSIVADYAAANRTGNPNAQARALLKLAHGISQDQQTQGQTDFVLEGYELAMPVGDRQATTLGSLLGVMAAELALAWDWGNGQRHYLSFNNSHALLGARLARLMQYAQQLNLPGELDMRAYGAAQAARKSPTWMQLIGSGLPFWGAAIGYSVALLLWAIAWLGFWVGVRQVAWLGSDFRPMYAFPLIGFGVGTFMRFNHYFPELPSAWLRRPPETFGDLGAIVQDPQALPDRAGPIALTGKLLGRSGVANWLAQDLRLECDGVRVRLHYPSVLGWLTNFGWADNRASDLRGQVVTVTGWLRRGATPWLDVERLRNNYGKTRWGGQQFWNVIVAIAAVTIGLVWLGVFEDLIAVIYRLQLPKR
jgi:Zn-dependent protease with chaperone function